MKIDSLGTVIYALQVGKFDAEYHDILVKKDFLFKLGKMTTEIVSTISSIVLSKLKNNKKYLNYGVLSLLVTEVVSHILYNHLVSVFVPNVEIKEEDEYLTPSAHDLMNAMIAEMQDADEYELNRKDLSLVEEPLKDKDKVMAELVEIFDAYYTMYKLPSYNISSEEWDNLFNLTYTMFKEKNLLDNYFEAMYELFRFGLADALVRESSNLTIQNFLNHLYILGLFGLPHEDTQKINQELLTLSGKLIDLTKVRAHKKTTHIE